MTSLPALVAAPEPVWLGGDVSVRSIVEMVDDAVDLPYVLPALLGTGAFHLVERQRLFPGLRGVAVPVIGRLAPVGAFVHGTLSDVDAESRSADGHSTASGVPASRATKKPAPRWRAPLPEPVPAQVTSGASFAPATRRELVRRRHTRSSSLFRSWPRCSIWPGASRSIACRCLRVIAAACPKTPASAPSVPIRPGAPAPGRVIYGRSNDRMKRITTLLGALLLVLCFGAGQAVAADGGGAAQTAGQSAPSGQTAGGAGSAYQAGPSNSAGSIRVLSPGNDGAVSQSNNTTAAAIAANATRRTRAPASRRRAAPWFRLHPDRRPGGPEQAGCRRRRQRGADRAVQQRRVDPRSQPRQRRRCDPVELGDRRRGRPERQPDGSDRSTRRRAVGVPAPTTRRSPARRLRTTRTPTRMRRRSR